MLSRFFVTRGAKKSERKVRHIMPDLSLFLLPTGLSAPGGSKRAVCRTGKQPGPSPRLNGGTDERTCCCAKWTEACRNPKGQCSWKMFHTCSPSFFAFSIAQMTALDSTEKKNHPSFRLRIRETGFWCSPSAWYNKKSPVPVFSSRHRIRKPQIKRRRLLGAGTCNHECDSQRGA